MSIRLRQLIRQVRACKTAAEERAVIAKESALMRTAFKDGNETHRARNVAKLLYMHMLGYPSHFGQMECIKIIASPGFSDKRVGYLGLMLLLQEKDEVLMLGTNSLKSDLSHPIPQVVGLALCAVGNLATPDMSRDLAMEVDKHLRPGSSSNIRKKAALCTVRVLRKCPELVEEFLDRVVALLVERSHGVVLCGVQLLTAIMGIDPGQGPDLVKVVPTLVRLMRNLLSTAFSSEYDVAGVTDPFLQVEVLRLLRRLGQHSTEASDEVNSVLSQVATTTETAKNAGNAILYECVRTIMQLDSETSLRSMAVNILGRFLLHRDNNMRYVALRTLGKVVSQDLASVQRHRGTIVECLKDPDPSIRVRALELIYQLISRKNARALVAELLNYLVVAPADQRREMCSKILQLLEDHAPSARWRVGTLLSILGIAGGVCDRSIPSAAVVYVCQNQELHAHAAHKTFRMIQDDLTQSSLTLAGVWFAGEYGDLLLRPCEALPPESGVDGEEDVDGTMAEWGKSAGTSAADDEDDAGGAGGHGAGGKSNNSVSLSDGGKVAGSGGIGLSGALGGGSSSLGAAYEAIEASDIVDLMAKIMKDHNSDRVTRGYVLTALTKLAGRLGEEHEDAIEQLLNTYSGSMNLELQARSCEFTQLLRPDLASLRGGMLDRMPVADEETVRNRRARFRNDDNGSGGGGGGGGDLLGEGEDGDSDLDDDDADRGLPSFRIAKARHKRGGSSDRGSSGGASKSVQPLTGPSPGGTGSGGGLLSAPKQTQQPVTNLLDLDDLFGAGGGGGGGGGSEGAQQAGAGAGQGAASSTVDLMADIFAAPAAGAGAASAALVLPQTQQQVTATPLADPFATPAAPAPGGAAAAGGAGAFGGSITAALAAGPAQASPSFLAFEKDGLSLMFELSKPSPTAPGTTQIKATFTNSSASDVKALHFQAAVPKYLQLEMQSASGSVVKAGGLGSVTQTVRVTNSMQGQKKLLMKLRLAYEVGGKKMQEMASVNSFPPGY